MHAIDLFAGGGGLTYGLKQAGFAVTAAVENEPHACATLAANHPEVTIYQRNIQDTSGRELRAAATTKDIDLLVGCPPCQGFTSLTAKYRRTDPRNNLIHEMARLVKEIQPRAIMMENVPGLAQRGKASAGPLLRGYQSSGLFPGNGSLTSGGLRRTAVSQTLGIACRARVRHPDARRDA